MNSDYNNRYQTSFFDQWRDFTYQSGIPTSIYKAAKNSKYFIRCMGVKEEISGHNGCVNTVHWNKAGTILLSGSDDRHLNLYSYPSYHLLEKVNSGHKANIFNAKFIPHSNDTKICSCSGDGIIHYNNLNDRKNHGKNPFKCHVGIVYDVITHNQDANGFISCGEDGTVRYYDLRTNLSCNCLHCNKHILIDVGQAVTTCTLNPLNPNEIVIGCDDGTIRAYDRRYRFTQETQKISQTTRLSSSSSSTSPQSTNSKSNGVIYAYRPPQSHLNNMPGSHFNNRLTCLIFNSKGDELLASYCPSLLTLISTVPKSNVTSVEIDETRKNLFNDSSLYPGDCNNDLNNLHENRDSKKLIPFSAQQQSTTTAAATTTTTTTTTNGSPRKYSRKKSFKNNRHLSSMEIISTTNTQELDQQPNTTTNTNVDNYNLPHNIQSTNDDLNTTLLITEDNEEEYSPIIFDDDDDDAADNDDNNNDDNHNIINHHLLEQSNNDQNLNNSSSDPYSSTNIISTNSNDNNNNNISIFNMDIDDPNTTLTSTLSNEIVGNISGGEHSSQTAPLPIYSEGDRDLISSPITNVSRIHPNYLSTSNADRLHYRRRSRTINYAPSLHEYQSSNASRDHFDNQTINTNHTEIDSISNSNDFKDNTLLKGNQKSGYHKCKNNLESANHSSTNNTNENISRHNNNIDYNPYYFNTPDSLNNIGEYDRLRVYLDNIFVPQYVYTYRGHHNSRTMIKECNFYGDNFVMSGSDDGNVFIWDKLSSLIVNVFNADNNVVNCLQPHPVDPLIACSGIDSSIKIISPIKNQSMPARDINAIIASNEREMRGASNYYFDATPTMIFHVLLALERIQRNRGDDNSPSMDPSYTDSDRNFDDLTFDRDAIARRARDSLRNFGRNRQNNRTTRRSRHNNSNNNNDDNNNNNDINQSIINNSTRNYNASSSSSSSSSDSNQQ